MAMIDLILHCRYLRRFDSACGFFFIAVTLFCFTTYCTFRYLLCLFNVIITAITSPCNRTRSVISTASCSRCHPHWWNLTVTVVAWKVGVVFEKVLYKDFYHCYPVGLFCNTSTATSLQIPSAHCKLLVARRECATACLRPGADLCAS